MVSVLSEQTPEAPNQGEEGSLAPVVPSPAPQERPVLPPPPLAGRVPQRMVSSGIGPRTLRDARATGSFDDDWEMQKLPTEVVSEGSVLVPKKSRGAVGSRDYLRYMTEATAALEHKFGVPSHMVSTRDGESEEGDETKYRFIQEAFVSNFTKVDELKRRMMEYDLMDILQIPKLVDASASHPLDMFSEEKEDLFVCFNSIEKSHVLVWQATINEWRKPADRESSRWGQLLMFNSCTVALREHLRDSYDSLPAEHKGSITYLYFLLRAIFVMTRDNVSALKRYLRYFREKGLRRIKGENVLIAKKELEAVCSRLNEVGELPKETPLDILEGLILCSVPEFAELFKFKLLSARNQGVTPQDTLSACKNILNSAVDQYHSLCTSGQWHLARSVGRAHLAQQSDGPTCWNCGGPHTLGKCTKEKDQKRIDANKKKWEEARAESKSAGNQTSGRKKWGENSNNSQVMMINGVPHAFCGKKGSNGSPCGWNPSHSSKYHGVAEREGASFNLADHSPQHPLVLAQGRSNVTQGVVSANNFGIAKDQVVAALSSLERNATSEDTMQMIAAFRNLLSIN